MYEELFTFEEDVLKVLANRKRLEIVQLLSHGPLTVGEMVEMLGLRQPNLSQHLMLLRRQGVVQARRDGTAMHYELTDKRIPEALREVRRFLKDRHPELPEPPGGGAYPVVRDPVCKMRISRAEAGANAKSHGETYYFCATGCKEKFVGDPERYLGKRTAAVKRPVAAKRLAAVRRS